MFPEGWSIIKADRLCIVYKRLSDGKITVKGKRVPKDFILTQEEVKAYLKGGIVSCVKLIRDRMPCSLRQAVDMVNEARGPVYIREV